MIRIIIGILFLFLNLSSVTAQDIKSWHKKHDDGIITTLNGTFNNCIPFKAMIAQYPDSIVGIWKLKNKSAYYLEGSAHDNVVELIEVDSVGNATGYLFYREDTESPKYAYWINKDRRIMHVLKIHENNFQSSQFKTCKTEKYSINIVNTDPYTSSGVVVKNDSHTLQRFTLADSLYLTQYSNLLPDKTTLPLNVELAQTLRNCLNDKNAETIPLHTICKSKNGEYIHAAWPTEMNQSMRTIWDKIRNNKSKWLLENKHSTGRFSRLLDTELIPFYVDDTYMSFLLKVNKMDGKAILFPVNWHRKKEKIIKAPMIFKKSFDLIAFVEENKDEVIKQLVKVDQEKTDFLRSLNFPHYLISKNGFIFFSEIDKNFGWRSFFIPYEKLEGNYEWFHPLKKLIRHGSN